MLDVLSKNKNIEKPQKCQDPKKVWIVKNVYLMKKVKGCCLEEETPLSPDKDTFNNNKKETEIQIKKIFLKKDI